MQKKETRDPLLSLSDNALENFLVEQKAISRDDCSRARAFMAESRTNFGTAILFLGILGERQLGVLLERHFALRYAPPSQIMGLGRGKNILTPERARELQVFPLTFIDDSGQKILLLGMTDPFDRTAIRKVEELCRLRVQPAFIYLSDLQALYKRFYHQGLEIFLDAAGAGETTVNRRLDAVLPQGKVKKSAPPDPGADLRIQALVSLLIKKGVFTREEWEREVAACC